MGEQGARPDKLVAEIAANQHGVVSVWQLREAGLGRNAIYRRVRAGRLHSLYRGVYAIGFESSTPERRWMAAVLVCGRGGLVVHGKPEAGSKRDEIEVNVESTQTILDHWGAALSHRSAASLWRLLPAGEGFADVSIPGDGGRRRRDGIRIHRSRTLLPADVTLRNGIPVTSPARTLSDLRRVVSTPDRKGLISPTELRRAIREANVLGLPVGDEERRDRTRSELERDFLRLCQRYELPTPEVNVRVGSHLVDFLWRGPMLVVETDGFRYHRGRAAFEDDRARDLDLRVLGYEVVRLSYRQVTSEPQAVADVLRAALGSGAVRAGRRWP